MVQDPDVPAQHHDVRIAAAVAVLAGEGADDVAAHHDVDVRLVRRWADQFLRGGSAAVRNEPVGDEVAARDRLLAAINHELRTPLTVIDGYTRLLGGSAGDRFDTDDLLARVQRELGRLEELLGRLNETTAASLGRLSLRRAPVLLTQLLEPHEAEVEGDRPIEVDADRVRTVVDDLVALAWDGPQTTDVSVRATADDTWADIVVDRIGAPYDPSRLQAELDPFSPREGHEHVTFGLHLALALTVLHGGQLGVRREGQRDELWLRLPVRPPHTDDAVVHLTR